MNLSLYIHIPFCKTKCIYCDFYSITSLDKSACIASKIADELHIVSKRLISEESRFSTVFLGGGTPSLLDPDRITKIITTASKLIDIDEDAEVTIEVNPDDVAPEKADKWAASGINRVSIGAQSFNDRELEFLTRRHSASHVREAIEVIRSSGIKNLSLDLIYGIPGQTIDSWLETVRTACSIDPQHISMYCLTAEENTPLFDMIKRGKVEMPDDDSLFEQYSRAIDLLDEHGILQYEISNFAKTGFESRHNLTYWTLRPYIGIGPSAASYIHPNRWKNVSDLDEYVRRIEAGNDAVEESESLSAETQADEYVMLSLRLADGLDLGEYSRRFDVDLLHANRDKLDRFRDEGLIQLDQNRLRLTRRGMFLSDEIIGHLT